MTATLLVRLSFATAAFVSIAAGQVPRARPTLTPEVAAPATAGSATRLLLRVRLPKDVHVQSDRPRDASLIPTALTITPPPGVAVARISYPPSTDLRQPGRDTPLAVFSGEFVIAVDVAVTARGPVTIPAQLRYQACTEQVCFAPARAAVEWEVSVDVP